LWHYALRYQAVHKGMVGRRTGRFGGLRIQIKNTKEVGTVTTHFVMTELAKDAIPSRYDQPSVLSAPNFKAEVLFRG